MKEQIIMLKSYRKEIEVLSLTIDIPYYEDERKKYFWRYEDVLTKLFNNKREDKDILDIINYYNSNRITVRINLTGYLEDSYSTKEECIEHLKTWLTSNLDISNDKIEVEFNKGYIYEIDEWENNIPTFEDDKIIRNYIDWER